MTDAANTRELALGILLEITQNGAYSHLALASVLEKHQYLEKKERAFLTRIVEGTLENLIRIDYIINQFSKVPAEKMKPAIRCIMQSAVYQICFMDAVPDSAAFNEGVRLAKKRGFKNLSGFVNGVLRNICRKKDSIGLPDRETDPENYLSVRYSIPKWMIRMWQEEGRPNEDIEAMLQAFQAQAFLTICTNTQACTPE